MRALLLLAIAPLLCSCSTVRVDGPDKSGLAPSDVRQITAIAASCANDYGDLRRIEALEPAKVRVELRQELVLAGAGGGYFNEFETRFYLVKEGGEWHPLRNRSGKVAFEHRDWSKKWPWGNFP